jgi:hypothetical protein
VRLFGIFGAGLLVGTALCVIIPEGINAVIDQQPLHHLSPHHSHTQMLSDAKQQQHQGRQTL